MVALVQVVVLQQKALFVVVMDIVRANLPIAVYVKLDGRVMTAVWDNVQVQELGLISLDKIMKLIGLCKNVQVVVYVIENSECATVNQVIAVQVVTCLIVLSGEYIIRRVVEEVLVVLVPVQAMVKCLFINSERTFPTSQYFLILNAPWGLESRCKSIKKVAVLPIWEVVAITQTLSLTKQKDLMSSEMDPPQAVASCGGEVLLKSWQGKGSWKTTRSISGHCHLLACIALDMGFVWVKRSMQPEL
jgi:hypothetical protein